MHYQTLRANLVSGLSKVIGSFMASLSGSSREQ
jgi:hypothetical protein